ncbi:phosphatase PAP2 family protein [Streptomyces bobili]|uniref:phosphatase PAP2 family protein n=1 Tax=Streptomyces bobili TaxID=67280 RepID=UPI0037B895AD
MNAPRPVTAIAFTMAALCAVATALTAVWKVSVHCTVACAFVALLSCAYDAEGPWPLTAAPLVALIGWSRVRLRAHTVAQVMVGCLLGTAGAAFLWHLASAVAA